MNNFVRYTQDLEKWKRHFTNSTRKQGKYHIIKSMPKINLVTPTQAAVEQAKSQLKAVEHLKTTKQPMEKKKKKPIKGKVIKSQTHSTSSSSKGRTQKEKR